MQSYDIIIRGLDVEAIIGVSSEERAVQRKLSIDLELTVRGQATQTDSLEDTVDYAAVASLVSALSGSRPYNTLERLADFVCGELLATFSRADSVSLIVSKPNPPMAIEVTSCAVRLMKKRDNRSNYL
jgi:dihydroneopterin aldolase